MNTIFCLLATLSLWDYPDRYLRHVELRDQFITAVREGDTETMKETCEKGVALLPDDPVWHYNLACALAYFKDPEPALNALEEAIDLGFRDADAIAADRDLKRISGNPRFGELVEYAREKARRPILSGPLAVVPATGNFGSQIHLGELNLAWNFDLGCFEAKLSLLQTTKGGNVGDLYMNRDGEHSRLNIKSWPGLTPVRLDSEGRSRRMDLDFPNILFPYPVFGNCSRALTEGPYWRSLPRALMTTDAWRLSTMAKFYLSNQIWVFPVVKDYDFTPSGYGDIFASVTPYWIATQGASFTDQQYLRAALEVSRSLNPSVKRTIVSSGRLAPTIQALLRRSLRGVASDEDYLSEKAHPTCFATNALDIARLKNAAKSLTTAQIPPVAIIAGVMSDKKPTAPTAFPELTYATACAWAFVLRNPETTRSFVVRAGGGAEYQFVAVHNKEAAKIDRIAPDAARITLDKSLITPTNRVDVAIFAKTGESLWSAPSFVSFAVVDPAAPYSDPVLTPSEIVEL